jgi:hypothetical protein
MILFLSGVKPNVLQFPIYIVAKTLQACGEFIRVKEEDMMILAEVVILEYNLTLNLGDLLLFYSAHHSFQSRGPICRGGVITVLARALHINIGNLQPLVGVHRLGFTTPNSRGMVRRTQGIYFLNIPGDDHLIATPLSQGLFSIEDGHLHYDAQVEANLP